MCEHLDAYLMSTTDVKAEPHNVVYVEDIDRLPKELLDTIGFLPSITEDNYNDFVDALIEHGLVEHEVELIIERYLNNKSWGEIRDSLGWTSVYGARQVLQRAINKLKIKGFKPKTVRQ